MTFVDTKEAIAVLGRNDEYLSVMSQHFSSRITARGTELILDGQDGEVEQLARLLSELIYLYREGNPITSHDVRYSIRMILEGQADFLHQMFADTVLVTARGRHIKPRTLGQSQYLEAIRRNPITFGIGPAGTGKTYLAVAMAVFSLKSKQVERIILTRPAVEAGEKLGFLPGDLQEKVDPYLRPLYDAMYDIMGTDTVQKYMAKNIIEVAPLAYMRGRTLEDSFIILDEAQNTTGEQMKMFLTRMGFGSKMVITGDITQIDLPSGVKSGLKHAQAVLAGVPGIALLNLSESDVVRHEIVSRIIKAYAQYDQN
ncbi:PhoH family protein [Sporomusa acidovorans]|uniref:PhoH-like protein n=1 Tax=Sporomusa acidovorans (strain ATCC 49682 / DSM 3132 / Mol) TaxID=1123286 RepID=A0ABZ3J4K5_SPOA4|nr:PhoH family protein [Sporomusa acidovorans]OZC23126.1 PhoH-like protein [Sporomusa acidovorans DSM 3132]SDF06180.1 phosphate starvation-inducible protein PhoH [Sporomusa acidovorans]